MTRWILLSLFGLGCTMEVPVQRPCESYGVFCQQDFVPYSSSLDVREYHFQGIFGSSATDIWAVGGLAVSTDKVTAPSSKGVVLHWDGRRWEPAMDVQDRRVLSVRGFRQGKVLLAAADWSVTLYDSANRSFGAPTAATGHAESVVRAMWASGENDLWLAGDSGKLAYKDAMGWRYPASATTSKLWSIGGDGTGKVWAGGSSGVIVECSADLSCTHNTIGTGGFFGISYPLAVGTETIFDLRTKMDVGGDTCKNKKLRAVWMASPTSNEAWAVGQGGTIVLLKDGVCTAFSAPAVDLAAVWGDAATGEVWAVGDNGTILRYTPPPL